MRYLLLFLQKNNSSINNIENSVLVYDLWTDNLIWEMPAQGDDDEGKQARYRAVYGYMYHEACCLLLLE